jgi:hypothetical protein
VLLLIVVTTVTLHISVVGASWWSPFSLPHRGGGAASRSSPATAAPGVTLRVDDYHHQVRIVLVY